jgi:alcohol dehydrogenase class IV
MDTFKFSSAFPKVTFGKGTLLQLAQVITEIGCTAVLVLCTPEQVDLGAKVHTLAQGKSVGVYSKATMHTPTHITEEAMKLVLEKKADGILSVGGGSTTGLGKAISFRTGLPHLCIPTTYAGSEMTPILGETENGLKTTRRDHKILPTAVLYDVDLTMTLPPRMGTHSGINAVAHAGKTLIGPII